MSIWKNNRRGSLLHRKNGYKTVKALRYDYIIRLDEEKRKIRKDEQRKIEEDEKREQIRYETKTSVIKIVTKEEILEDQKAELRLISNIIKKGEKIKKRNDNHKHTRKCPMCKINKADSEHHIIPRSYGGDDFEYNKIKLCRKCHDITELITDELLKQKPYTSNTIRRLIITGVFLH